MRARAIVASVASAGWRSGLHEERTRWPRPFPKPPRASSRRPANCARRSTTATPCWRRRAPTARRAGFRRNWRGNWRGGSPNQSNSSNSSAGATFEALERDAWDVAFLANDPKRAERIAFTAPYVTIEGAYLVARELALTGNADVDRAGVRIAVGKGSAYDLFLKREIRPPRSSKRRRRPAPSICSRAKARRRRWRQTTVEAYAKTHPDARLLPGRFMVINQAVATPKARLAAAAYSNDFVEEMKASGFVARALAASGQTDASVAPPASRN